MSKSKSKSKKHELEARLYGATLVRGWALAGPGPARFGWCASFGSYRHFVGRTLDEVEAKLDERDRWRSEIVGRVA